MRPPYFRLTGQAAVAARVSPRVAATPVCRFIVTSGAVCGLALCIWALAVPAQAQSAQEGTAENAGLKRDALAIEQRNFDRLLQTGRYESAVESGKRLVVLAIELHGNGSLEAGNALTSLAIAQREAGNFDAARENFRAAISAIETSKDRLAKELIEPLQGLGRTTLRAQRPDLSADVLERALHISHVNEGPQNLEQLALLNELSEAYYHLGDYKQADALQKYAVGLFERRYPEKDDKRVIPALYQRALWLTRMNQPLQAQTVYLEIIRIIERADGRAALELIPALIGVANTFIYSTDPDARQQGERRLRRAISIAEGNEAATRPNHADTEIALGDFYNLIGERTSARRAYERAWEILDTGELEDLAARDERFARPFPLSQQDVHPEPGPVGEIADFGETYGGEDNFGYVSVAYDVNDRGRVDNFRVVESVPPGFKDDEALRWVRRFVFRPRMEDGELVDTLNQEYRYEFTYRDGEVPDDVDASPAAGDAAQTDATDGEPAGPPPADEGTNTSGESR